MKEIIAYAIVVAGIPMFVGHLIGTILSSPISLIVGLSRKGKDTPLTATEAAEAAAKDKAAWVFRGKLKMATGDIISHTCIDVFSGFGTFLSAGLLFHFFGLRPGVAVFLIVAAWQIFFVFRFGQSLRILFGHFAGMIVGWFVVMQLFSR